MMTAKITPLGNLIIGKLDSTANLRYIRLVTGLPTKKNSETIQQYILDTWCVWYVKEFGHASESQILKLLLFLKNKSYNKDLLSAVVCKLTTIPILSEYSHTGAPELV